MRYLGKIKLIKNNEIRNVVFKLWCENGDDDEGIFYYVDSEEEFEELMSQRRDNQWDLLSYKKEIVEQNYVLGYDSINGIKLNEKIYSDELYEFYIIEKEDFIDKLIGWISEATKDKQLMKDDLKLLISWEDEYIFTSNLTNDYISSKCPRFNNTCKELLELNATL